MPQFLLLIAILGLVSSTGFLLLVMVAALRFRQRARRADAAPCLGDQELPPVSVIKPVCGLEPLLEQNLESLFQQDYPTFELIFGARTADDPAIAVVNQLRRRYPEVKARCVFSGDPIWPNPRVYSEHKMIAAAEYDYLVIGDSDVRVPRDYLRNIVAPLRDPEVGLVTCIYRGKPSGGAWSRLEAAGFSVELTSGVLVADLLEGMKFALGPTTATRKDVLAHIGGIRVLADYHSDDYEIGRQIDAAGYRVVLSHVVIDHITLNRAMISRQIRWMRSTRFSRPAGHIGSGLTFATPFALLGFIVAAAWGYWTLALTLLAWGIVNRWVQALVVGWGVVRDPEIWRYLWYYPIRDLLGFFFWMASFTGRNFTWRGEPYRFGPGGRVVSLRHASPAEPSSHAAPVGPAGSD
ncbi:MAG: bacteriohopanetetrol glucosamine biosynthesis glycosyltransferase HpnI [Acidobacteriia bacterium]|nr:bacteriohopanetetrol glucosamine biosynthesis glycosyltransferase HpnI [Terriglobia bacterium]